MLLRIMLKRYVCYVFVCCYEYILKSHLLTLHQKQKKLMSAIPKQEAARYGDSTFGQIMMAKVICVHLVMELGYDMLFQDVDVYVL